MSDKKPESPARAVERAMDSDPEVKKARGETREQKEQRAYYEGRFQTHDPITGEPRDLDAPARTVRIDRGETLDRGTTA